MPSVEEHRSAVRECAFAILDVLKDENEDPTKVADALSDTLKPLLALPDLAQVGVPRKGNHFKNSLWLYYDAQLSILLGPIPKLFSVPVHNHGTWEMLSLYRGAVKYTSYIRLDDTSRDYYARLEPHHDLILREGDVTLVPPPPNDVHGFTGLAHDTYALSIVGGPLAPVREYYFPSEETYITREPKEWERPA